MKIVLLRVGIDTGCGGINGPLFADGSFEYIPIPDGHKIDPRTYGNSFGRYGRRFIEYFPVSRQEKMSSRSMHVDPEFETFTYGDPTPPKAGLRRLMPGDLLVFYGGLEGCDFDSAPALYLMGFFEVEYAGLVETFSQKELRGVKANFHVRHPSVFDAQRNRLVLVKGTRNSRLLQKAKKISTYGTNSAGKPIKILSPAMQKIFGDFDGKVSIQRSPPRWVHADYTKKARDFIFSLV